MSGFFKQIDDTDEIRQGDIIRKIDTKTRKAESLGIVITADCDIAQEKAGGRFNWVEILPLENYIEGPWAVEQLRRHAKKRSKEVREYLGAQIRKNNPELSEITHNSLVEWLRSKTPEEILELVTGAIPDASSKQLRDLKVFSLASVANNEHMPLRRLKEIWELTGISEAEQRTNITKSLKDGGGFQDYFVLPELPRHTGLGFVVVLRSMGTIMSHDLFLTEQDAKIIGRPDAFHRLGRLTDGIRYAITQKLAFLFSRIGMPTMYESTCETACDLAVEEFFNKIRVEH